jgi:hypothetical protein
MSTAGHFVTMVGVIAFYKITNYSVGKLIKNILNSNSIRYYFSKNVYGIIKKI